MTVETLAFVPVAPANDVPPGWVLKVQVGHRLLAVANSEGTFYAFDHACSHAGGPLGDNRLKEGRFVECPWHNSAFDVCTAEPIRGPARKALRTYPVKVEDGQILVSVGEPSSNGNHPDPE
jgi:3-phenylpropionate/trans-cinnamate dioxygenase ferredoxin component